MTKDILSYLLNYQLAKWLKSSQSTSHCFLIVFCLFSSILKIVYHSNHFFHVYFSSVKYIDMVVQSISRILFVLQNWILPFLNTSYFQILYKNEENRIDIG